MKDLFQYMKTMTKAKQNSHFNKLYHCKFSSFIRECCNGEGDHGTGAQWQIGVDVSTMLLVSIRPTAIKARPVHPQENRAFVMQT